MLLARQFLQKTTVARGPRTGLFARKNESIEFSEFKFGIQITQCKITILIFKNLLYLLNSQFSNQTIQFWELCDRAFLKKLTNRKHICAPPHRAPSMETPWGMGPKHQEKYLPLKCTCTGQYPQVLHMGVIHKSMWTCQGEGGLPNVHIST